ncbi:MAG: hypothetical protein DYG93_11155 [Leptolyngbya sp. PLA2]|nr:hypothetical protein [Leptolyngbya sp.]MCE7972201.1 hypothetical protein [Leptolyngbya sp. PL-A2]MCQ3941221.1 hypothetical protein [cyanobacterium CYA1]MDL1905506.1 hypothetical protein [Synechococcales cyanobacterium CNB]
MNKASEALSDRLVTVHTQAGLYRIDPSEVSLIGPGPNMGTTLLFLRQGGGIVMSAGPESVYAALCGQPQPRGPVLIKPEHNGQIGGNGGAH